MAPKTNSYKYKCPAQGGALKQWRRDPESNRATRICNPLHNRFAIAPQTEADKTPAKPSKKKGSDASFFQTGAGNETRTRDLNLGKVALYQLSYSRSFRQLGMFV